MASEDTAIDIEFEDDSSSFASGSSSKMQALALEGEFSYYVTNDWDWNAKYRQDGRLERHRSVRFALRLGSVHLSLSLSPSPLHLYFLSILLFLPSQVYSDLFIVSYYLSFVLFPSPFSLVLHSALVSQFPSSSQTSLPPSSSTSSLICLFFSSVPLSFVLHCHKKPLCLWSCSFSFLLFDVQPNWLKPCKQTWFDRTTSTHALYFERSLSHVQLPFNSTQRNTIQGVKRKINAEREIRRRLEQRLKEGKSAIHAKQEEVCVCVCK